MPAAVEYTLPVELTHAVAGPVMTGTGKALTVTLYTIGADALQLLLFV
jgi:hypothetical protein